MPDAKVIELRVCSCGSKAEIVTEYYPGTQYKMYRICCSRCFIKTGAKRRLSDAIREWNNPFTVHLN